MAARDMELPGFPVSEKIASQAEEFIALQPDKFAVKRDLMPITADSGKMVPWKHVKDGIPWAMETGRSQ